MRGVLKDKSRAIRIELMVSIVAPFMLRMY